MRAALAVALALAALPIGGCGDDDGPGGDRPQLKVSAAASLKEAFSTYARTFEPAHAAMSFAGSDELAAQIRSGAAPDVFAAANTRLPEELFADGLVERPIAFASNELVVAVPSEDDEINSLADLTGSGVRIAIGDKDVPIGRYTRELLGRLDRATAAGILDNVASEEPDVLGIVGKLTQGAVAAGFVYATDVQAAKGQLRALTLPARLRPRVAYGIAVVKDGAHATEARAFIDGLLSGPGREALRAAGFRPPPS